MNLVTSQCSVSSIMQFLYFACALLSLTSVIARPQYQLPGNLGPAEPYEFNYKVEYPPTNTFFGQNEHGDVAGNKHGRYYVLLPDGRTMTVNYVADGQGYNPKVTYQGGGVGAIAGR